MMQKCFFMIKQLASSVELEVIKLYPRIVYHGNIFYENLINLLRNRF